MRTLKLVFFGFVALPFFCNAQTQTNPTTPPAYFNLDLTPEQRAADLVSHMTLDDKISQMVDVAPAIPRLGIPAYNWWNEGLHGVARSGIATVFPQAIGLAATWDTDLIHRVGDVISTEARGKYNDAIAHGNTGRYYGLTFWSPNINIFRDPRWGRGQETYGEDPFLTGRLGVAFVTGLQGNDPHYLKVISTPKHYAVHSGPESLRHRFDAPVSLHDLYDTYTPAFRATVVDGHADSVMCAYNSIRGEPACANHLLLGMLRNNWGFRGYVVSDCWAISDLYQGHQFVMTLDQAAALSVRAGTDLSCGSQFKTLERSLEDRLLPGEDIDRAVRRLFEARFRLGMFDPPERVPWSKLSLADVDTPAHREVALQAARESIVLLKNERNILPLGPKTKNILVVGPTADSLDVLLGNYNGTPSKYTTILEGIRKKFAQAKVTYTVGAPLTESRALPIPSGVLCAFCVPAIVKSGLNGEYFSNPRLEGTPVVTRIDPEVNFEWNNVSPAPGVPAEYFSVRWTGELIPPADGDYRLGASSDGGYRLYLDGKLLLDDWAPHAERGITVSVHLQAGHAYPIKLEYYHYSWESAVRLLWLPSQLQEQAVAAARGADAIVAVVGITAQLEGEESDSSDPGFFGGDRTDITLPVPQEKLLEALAATGKPLIVVLTSGSALAVNWANEHAAAILEAWYPGEEGGKAVADVLSGEYNPSGRLPVTFYKSVAQLPPFTDYSMFNRTYRYLNEAPLYAFGYGLSYATFAYGEPMLAETRSGTNAYRSVIVRVTNSSKVAGDEVAELYVSHPGLEGAPIRSLAGFHRVRLAGGESKEITFGLGERELSVVDASGNRSVPVGPAEIWVGSSQPGSGANGKSARITINAATDVPN
jgi:beta-glucosidase